MKVHIFSICWNEELILPFYFKHYRERFKDVKFTIYDNMSTDNSRMIIKENGAELIDHNTNEEIRDDLYLKIKNNCWKNSDADWVIVCDVDEWIDCNDFFLKNTECTIVRPEAFDMVGNTYNLDKIVRGMRVPAMDKCLLFRPNEIREINYKPGAHECNPIGNIKFNNERILLYHMKYFRPFYLIKRHKIYAHRLSQINRKNFWGQGYRRSVKGLVYNYLNIRLKSVKIRRPVERKSIKGITLLSRH